MPSVPLRSPRATLRSRALAWGISYSGRGKETLLKALIVGCATAPSVVSCSSPPATVLQGAEDVTRVFDSEHDAMDAAKEAAARYLEVTTKIASEGGREPGRMQEVATPEHSYQLQSTYKEYERGGITMLGVPTWNSIRLQSYYESEGSASVSVYACLDISETALIDEGGRDITPQERSLATPYVIRMTSTGPGQQLLVDEANPWPGTDFC